MPIPLSPEKALPAQRHVCQTGARHLVSEVIAKRNAMQLRLQKSS
jgi:hypothetical protein